MMDYNMFFLSCMQRVMVWIPHHSSNIICTTIHNAHMVREHIIFIVVFIYIL
jgi:hypothetical protein